MVHHISLSVVRVFHQFPGLARTKIFNPRKRPNMNFDPMNIPIFILPPKRMRAILMEMAVSIRRPPVAEVDHILVAGLPI